ncbi:hypothetical protein C8R47DRAFT_1260392 [Mycena vitilis]|nr:hypothetical protein C8R47DRAFT_1260392 [Mycena vitilis]
MTSSSTLPSGSDALSCVCPYALIFPFRHSSTVGASASPKRRAIPTRYRAGLSVNGCILGATKGLGQMAWRRLRRPPGPRPGAKNPAVISVSCCFPEKKFCKTGYGYNLKVHPQVLPATATRSLSPTNDADSDERGHYKRDDRGHRVALYRPCRQSACPATWRGRLEAKDDRAFDGLLQPESDGDRGPSGVLAWLGFVWLWLQILQPAVSLGTFANPFCACGIEQFNRTGRHGEEMLGKRFVVSCEQAPICLSISRSGGRYIQDYTGVRQICRRADAIQGEVDSSDKLYLIQGRREPQKDKPPAAQTIRMRHYLTMVKTQKHREALTSLLLSTHLLAVEILRYGDHEHKREDDLSRRVCRFCKSEVETPEHALLACDASAEVKSLREVFMAQLFSDIPTLRRRMDELDLIEFFKAMIYERKTIALVAKFAHEVLEVFYATPVFRATGDWYTGILPETGVPERDCAV